MSVPAQLRPVPIEEYLDGESRAQRKHEYVEGVVYAMVGSGRRSIETACGPVSGSSK
jgi:hypothetical protein